jgi:hypothetical protein
MAIEVGATLARLDGHPVVHAAADNIRKNKETVDKIETLSADALGQFLNDTKVFTFDSGVNGISRFLLGLSSYDGTRAYLEKSRLSYPEGSQKTLEHELMHNLSRWRKSDPRRISPAKNKNLKIEGLMVEAGDFYESEVYSEVTRDPCPFCLSETSQKQY